ncbi:MAG: RNA ligase family protein [Candidatus Baldrarchaeia archaeon]
MNREEFRKRLEEQGEHFLCDNITRYQHVSRLTNDETEGLLDGEVIIQTKIDGANLTVAHTEERGHIIASRKNAKSVGGEPKVGFRGAVEYCLDHPGIMTLSKQYILRGEWLVRHSMNYPKEMMQHFYVFDVQRYEDNSYVHPDEYIPLLLKYGIQHVPVLARLSNPTMDELKALTEGPDEFGAEQKEGIVIKRYDFVNKYGRTQWGKIVHQSFEVKNKLTFRPKNADDITLKFASETVTQHLVVKIIDKIKSEDPDNNITIKAMPQILGLVWYDVFTEELWDFVKKNKVKAFNFYVAKKLVSHATREIALAYFNGILEEAES